jgi:hypothetical protein
MCSAAARSERERRAANRCARMLLLEPATHELAEAAA